MEDRISSEQHWALDPSIQVYFLSAASVAGLCLLLGIVLNVVPIDESTLPVSLRIAGGLLLGVGGAVSALFLWLSMWGYWWQVDRRERGMNVFWLLALSLGNGVGTLLYYFFVFRRVVERRIAKNSF
jgi:hypothetical protein